jgi:hypothetical protein
MRRPKLEPAARLPDGAMARCLASHTSVGGWVERGDVVPLTHPNVARHPTHFELFWRPTEDTLPLLEGAPAPARVCRAQ